MKKFVQYIITQGPGSAEGLEYSKLPQGLAAQDQKLLAEVAGGQASSVLPSHWIMMVGLIS